MVLVLLWFGPGWSTAAHGEDPRRDGTFVSLDLGWGSGDLEVQHGDLRAEPGWASGGKVLRGRFGIVLTPELLLSFQYGVWRRLLGEVQDGESVVNAPQDRYVGAGVASVHLYPQLGGFYLRAGLGWGTAFARVEGPSGQLSAESDGPVILMGAGYEIFFGHDLSLSAWFDVGHIEAGSEISGQLAQWGAAATLYTPSWLSALNF